MKLLSNFVVIVSMALGINGCASTGSNVTPTVVVTRNATFLASSQQEVAPRSTTTTPSDANRMGDGVRMGVPTPEPAVPQRELHFAGPTPQIPIPGNGRAGIASN
jgi:hypothetical protein